MKHNWRWSRLFSRMHLSHRLKKTHPKKVQQLQGNPELLRKAVSCLWDTAVGHSPNYIPNSAKLCRKKTKTLINNHHNSGNKNIKVCWNMNLPQTKASRVIKKKNRYRCQPRALPKRRVNILWSWKSFLGTMFSSKRSKIITKYKKWWPKHHEWAKLVLPWRPLLQNHSEKILMVNSTSYLSRTSSKSECQSPAQLLMFQHSTHEKALARWNNPVKRHLSLLLGGCNKITRIRCRKISGTNLYTLWSLGSARLPALTSKFWPRWRESRKLRWLGSLRISTNLRSSRLSREKAPTKMRRAHLPITQNLETMLGSC